MNASVIYDGYEEKIKQLVDKLEKKETEIADVWDRNREMQGQLNQLLKKIKNLERDVEDIGIERNLMKDVIQKM